MIIKRSQYLEILARKFSGKSLYLPQDAVYFDLHDADVLDMYARWARGNVFGFGAAPKWSKNFDCSSRAQSFCTYVKQKFAGQEYCPAVFVVYGYKDDIKEHAMTGFIVSGSAILFDQEVGMFSDLKEVYRVEMV